MILYIIISQPGFSSHCSSSMSPPDILVVNIGKLTMLNPMVAGLFFANFHGGTHMYISISHVIYIYTVVYNAHIYIII